MKPEIIENNTLHITVELSSENTGIISEGSEQSTLIIKYLLDNYGFNFSGYPENCEIRINGYEITDLYIIAVNSGTIVQAILGSSEGILHTATDAPFVGYASPNLYIMIYN